MKLNLRWRLVKSEFEDVSYEIHPLNMAAFQTYVSSGQGEEQKVKEMLEAVLPDHVRNIKGVQITDNDNEREATVEDIFTQALLMNLGVEMLTKLMEISTLAGTEEKN